LKYQKTIQISALSGTGLDDLQNEMVVELSKQRKIIELRIPQADYAVVSEVMRLGNIIHQDYEENDVILQVDLPAATAQKLEKYIVKK